MMPLDEVIRFARPDWLWALAPAVLLVWWARRPISPGADVGRAGFNSGDPAQSDSPWRVAIDAHLLPGLLNQVSQGPKDSIAGTVDFPETRGVAAESHPDRRRGSALASPFPWRSVVLLCTLVFALAGPLVPRPGTPADPPTLRPDRARVLVVDLSPAFDALPEPDRERVRTQLRRFVAALPPGETGLIAYAGDAWLLVPPTEDGAALDVFLSELSSGVVPVPGDRPGEALALARQTVAATGSPYPSIYWLRARSGGIPVELAQAPGGVNPRILKVDAGLDDWLAESDAGAAGRPVESRLNLVAAGERVDLGPVLALAGIFLLLPFPARRAWMPALAAFLIVLEPGSSRAAGIETDAGVMHYRAGRYAEAVTGFAQAVAAAPGDARAHYNLGNALARSGRLRDALAAYDAALRLRPGDDDTLHNRDLVARLLQSPKDSPQAPPPHTPPTPRASGEAERAAAQWLRAPPADAPGLLQRKLALEAARRHPGGAGAKVAPADVPTSTPATPARPRPANPDRKP